jgi:hypothetical protein
MNKEFVPYEESLALKELGFDEPCFGCYTKDGELSYDFSDNRGDSHYFQDCSAPTFSQAFRWFREKHNLCHQITRAGRDGEFNAFVNDYIYGNNGKYSPSIFTYEEAELACLRKLIELSLGRLR